jgi:hypothetical protein
MGVPALRNAPPVLSRPLNRVAFDDSDPGVRVAHHAGGDQPGHPRTQDYRVLTDLPQSKPPASVISRRTRR